MDLILILTGICGGLAQNIIIINCVRTFADGIEVEDMNDTKAVAKRFVRQGTYP